MFPIIIAFDWSRPVTFINCASQFSCLFVSERKKECTVYVTLVRPVLTYGCTVWDPQIASGQGRHWLFESPTIFHLFVTRPPEICANFVFKHIHTDRRRRAGVDGDVSNWK